MTPIHATIVGANQCDAEGYTVRAAAPVLAACRKLVDAGYDPRRPLYAYRGDVLALGVSSIGWGARYTVKENRYGTPVLHRHQSQQAGAATAPPMRLAA
jgi:hypothetical protein